MKRPRPKYQVFISSTLADLRPEREAVTWAILEARQIPAGMENFTAADDRGWGLIQRAIDLSDYYVLILAGRYGSFDREAKLSWTHREYRYARDKGIPVLPFIREPSSITADKMETEPPQQKRLRDFIDEVKNHHHYRGWRQGDDLRHEVVQAILSQIANDEDAGHARPGWFRGDELPSAVSMDEFARLSAEAADLRRQVAEHSARKAVLSFHWRDADDEEIVLSRERIVIQKPEHKPFHNHPLASAHFGLGDNRSIEERAADALRIFPLDFILRNTGPVVAKNVVADIEIERAERLVVYYSSYGSVKQTPYQLDPQQHVYVDGWSEPDLENDLPSASMRQRVRLVAAGGQEQLVSVTLYLEAHQTEVRVTYNIRDEEGATTQGRLTGVLKITGTRSMTEEEAEKELARL